MSNFKFLIVFFILLSAFFTPILAVKAEGYVQTQLNAAAGQGGANFGQAKDPRAVIATVIEVALGFVGILFVVFLIYGGYLILLSRGEEEKVKKGQNIVMYSVIGVFIILSAYSIVIFVDRYTRWASYNPDDGGVFYSESGWTTMDDTSQFKNPDPLYEPNPAGDNIWDDPGINLQ